MMTMTMTMGEGASGHAPAAGGELWLVLGDGRVAVSLRKSLSSCTLGELRCVSGMRKET